ncbi:AMP-binding protein [Polymorphobacter fuscus]|uniref:AMP-binding protein n=1 Tax=Sandarakinorhabdus fusca TaxID=1439888 RepID=A0A7C9GMV5_9SPHN|nr:AMP-binding protein [Polymorphobacter fuscus]KAB7648340.1 AMP-binding protein [Polymorphobacter fuscus]MQT15853.1 AMP-binding protein [Polymorphobacter fuscus]NJC07874.1 fatty-acyl-CoA synthase [Polymorphobacter fuscus]
MAAMSFGMIFESIATVVEPDRPATIHGDTVTSWRDFDRRTDAIAAATHAAGAVPGDRIAHLMRNSPAYLETTAAGFKARLVHVNVNYRYTGEELFYILDNSGAAVVVYDAEFEPLVSSIRHRLDVRLYLQVGGTTPDYAQDFDTVAESGAALPPQEHRPDDMLFIYTGGTTGMPKGVMWDQGALWEMIIAGQSVPAPADLAEHLANVAAGVGRNKSLVMPPLMHGTGFIIGIATLLRGGTVVTLPGASFDAEAAARTCADLACDYAVIVGDAFARPLVHALDAGHGSIASLGVMISSGVMWSPEVKAALLAHAPAMMIVDSLGSSEGLGLGAAVQTAANAGAPTRFINDGRTIVLDDDMKPIAPGSGQMGRIARAGPIPRGYWRDETKSATTFVTVDGVRYSIPGDFAIPEADGTMTLLGRGSQCINTSGEKVFPEEVEETLKTHPAVEDALVFGVADDKWGQAVTAVVEAPADTDCEALRAHVRTMLAGYKTPKRIILCEKIPRTPSGKADYATAKTMAL